MQLAGQQVTAAADEGIAVSLIAIVLTFALLAWQRHVMNRTRSLAIQTDHLHYKSDLLLNLAVIAALVLDQYAGLGMADPLFGLAIATWLAIGAWRGQADAVDDLMDREWPERSARPLSRWPHDTRNCRTCTTCAPEPAAIAISCSFMSTCRRR